MIQFGSVDAVPVTILTGFLGAGKTTLLNRILTGNHGLRVAVLVNDFGSINIDADLVVGVDSNVMSLDNGCVCCSIRSDLIETLEVEINKMRSAREEAIRAEKERRDREAELASLPVPEANRLVKSAPFEQLRGAIGLPATGVVAHRFGDSDGAGSTRYGDTVRTQSGAIVTAPADGVVLYAGPFRSYGQLLILNAGDGYHIVLAGLGRINVSLGQSVLAGEPVGAMDDVRLASAGDPENGKTGAELYVEFRKDGKPVDPAPWWIDRNSGRTGNDT